MKAKIIKRDELICLLQHALERLCAGDSFEGTIEYSCMKDGLKRDEFEVLAVVRQGNVNGQGSVIMIGEEGDHETRI